MSKSRGEVYGPVRPGEDVPVERVSLAPVRDQLSHGTYVLDEAQQAVHGALDNPETTKASAKAILNSAANKGFKGAYISFAMEQIWPPYQALAGAGDAGLYSLEFDNTSARLERQTTSIADLSLSRLAERIAASNQAMMTFLTCELFRDGNIPVICGEPAKDALYYEAFSEQAQLQLAHTGRFFKTIPEIMDPASRIVASGSQSIRTHVFGIPNLLDGISAHEGITLTASQHRSAVQTTYNKGIVPYFYPTLPLMMTVDAQFADPETQRLLPERWTSNKDPDAYFAFPRPELIRAANTAAAEQADSFPVQTSCPVVHSRVSNPETPQSATPFTRALAQVVLQQLDTLYYPQW